MDFSTTLQAAWARNDSLLCVGLDPDPAKFPAALNGRSGAILEFCKSIADATADLACAFKPQIAYFAANRAEDQLEALIRHIHEKHPGIPVIL
ncbi:MAG: orotidine 5'-phosphate decarboxylase, partial [Rhodocyclaceae bacterium]|nr:orotidine 5'-phosphate decarboxylase [Rhodocyclaceae bacterium]